MNRFFKAYFIASLIYAVWFGVLMYAVDPMFLDVMECNTLPGDYLCVQSGYTRPFTTFLYPFLSVVIFSFLHAGIMKWRKRRSVKMIWLLIGCESLLLLALMVAMLARDGFVFSRDIGSVLTGTVFAACRCWVWPWLRPLPSPLFLCKSIVKTADFYIKNGSSSFQTAFC